MNSNNSNKKVSRCKTPGQLNTTSCAFKSSASKKFTPNLTRRPNLNETVGVCPGISDLKFKTTLVTNFEASEEFECDSVYNDYLQALMKTQFVERTVQENKQILQDQLLIQNESLHKRRQNLEQILKDTEEFQNKSEIVQLIDFLHDNFISFGSVCGNYNVKSQLHQFKNTLDPECDKIVLRNIKVFETQDEYEKFIHVLELCLTVSQKIVNSGRDFKEIHDLAENIKTVTDLINNVQKSQQKVSELEKNAMYSFLQNVSDNFAKGYPSWDTDSPVN